MTKLILAVLFALAATGCTTDEDETRTTLENAGFTKIEVDDVAFWGCGHGDKWGREFHAVNPVGKRVGGTVCCGVWKSCTVRF